MSKKNKSSEAQKDENVGGLNIGTKTFVSTILLLLGILILVGILTQVIPQGSFEYVVEDGRSVVVPGTYEQITDADPLPVWRWFTAPIEVLFTDRAVTAIMIMVFLLFVGGSFLVLEKSGILSYMIFSVIDKYESRKYQLLAIITLICMLLGSTMGIFEETITLVPITIALAMMLKWDTLIGIGMSVLAVGFGFSAGTLNPFTLGVAQTLSDVPMFSGLLLRVFVFAVVYGVLVTFLIRYAKKIEADPTKSLTYESDKAAKKRYENQLEQTHEKDAKKSKALKIFVSALGLVFVYIFIGFFVDGLSDYAMPVMAVGFAAGALVSGRVAGLRKGLFATFGKGVLSIAPSIILILLAMGITHIMDTGQIIDTILQFFYVNMEGLGPYWGVLAIFALVLIMNFFVGSATAKAFLLMPIIIPLADMINITRQTAIQAFTLGDGFTNMLYPTNVVLLITLGIAGVSYGKWFRWTWKIQLMLIIISIITLLIAVAIGYGPI